LKDDLPGREARAEEGGGRARQERHRRLGRLTARERIDALLDKGTFVELGKHTLHRHGGVSEALAANEHPGDGLVCGLGAVNGRTVAVHANDPTVLRGALGHAAARKLCRLLDLALDRGHPVIALADCDGVRVEEGTDAIEAYGEVIQRAIALKGRVPQLTLVCGLCVGAAAYHAALTDLTIMVEGQSYLFITGPRVTKVVTGEDVTLDELGGPAMHARKTGAVHAVVASEAEGIALLQRALALITEPRLDARDPAARETPELERIVPDEPRRAYDMRKVLASIFDIGSVLELSPRFGPNLLTAFARLAGRTVAVVASQPMALAGCIDIDASRKGAAFVTWAGQLKLAVITLVDVPGYLPGRRQEEGGILPHGAALLTAYGNARVPLICLVVRKSFGGASVLSFAAQVRLALPTARVAPMGAEATVEVVLGAATPGASADEQRAREEKKAAWLARHDHAWAAAESGYIDRVIAPSSARLEISKALERL
jgi:acetyl-CoA carboxylase carboxyltransferase component